MKLRYLLICSLFLVAACNEPSKVDEPVRQTKFSDNPPSEGKCAGWRRSLSRGKQTVAVEQCLRDKALANRAAAREEARELMEWDIVEGSNTSLKPLMVALSRFPGQDDLKQYLDSMALLPNAPGEYNQLDEALTAADYISEMGNIYWFDVETGTFPNDHHHLLANIAALSDMQGAAFMETPPAEDEMESASYRITAQFNGKDYQQIAENYGDWYDVEAVLMLLNRIAVDNPLESRFVTLLTGDQTAIVWVIDNNKLDRLQKEGLINLSEAEIAMRTGEAFETIAKSKFDVERWRNRGNLLTRP